MVGDDGFAPPFSCLWDMRDNYFSNPRYGGTLTVSRKNPIEPYHLYWNVYFPAPMSLVSGIEGMVREDGIGPSYKARPCVLQFELFPVNGQGGTTRTCDLSLPERAL